VGGYEPDMSGPTVDTADDSANPPDRVALRRMMAENFTGVYLTMLSIIQGVALTDLTTVTFAERAHFTAVNWIEVATMLWSLIYVWNHFMGDALMTRWIPDLEDAALLFGTGAFEIVGNHAIVWGPGAWLATLAMMFLAWAVGTFYIRSQEQRVVRDPTLMELLRRRIRPLLIQTLAGGALVGALALACLRLPANASLGLAGVAVAFVVSLVIGAVTTMYWRRVRRYAQTGKAM
jgi:hypothetical protein